MKRILIIIIILAKSNIFAQTHNEDLFSAVDIEYSQLYDELLAIVRTEFVLPIHDEAVTFVYDRYYGYGLHINPFGRIWLSNASYLQCDYGTPIFSMTSGIIRGIIFDRMITIEYNGIEISYRDLDINTNIKVGDIIDAGQLLGTRRGVDALHNYFNGIIIKVKYKSLYFDIGYIFNTIQTLTNP